MKKKKLKNNTPNKQPPKIIIKDPPTEEPPNLTNDAVCNLMKQVLSDWLNSKIDEIYALGKLHSLLDLAEKLKIPKNKTAFEFNLAELLITKKYFYKKMSDEEE